ncbi:MAG: hypothetical protein Q8K82_11320 [Gemmatimonadaceae bacterium]|nr:hypothetical protein [Gemmatimonadaceae bacterium]
MHPSMTRQCPQSFVTAQCLAVFVAACAPVGQHAERVESRGILYTSQAPGGTEDLRRLDPATGASTLLIAGDSSSSRSLAVWSADGRRLAWIQEYSTHDALFVADAAGGRARRVGRELPSAVLFPDWSPDGTSIVVSAGDSASHPGIFLVNVATGRSTSLRRDSSSYRCPSWSPSGDRLVVASYVRARSALVVLDLQGAVLDTIMRSDTTYLDCPQWSPRGDAILFTVFHGGGGSGWTRPAFHSNLAIVDLNSRHVAQLTRDAGVTNYGRWARDGDWIVFQSDRHAEPTRDESGVRTLLQNLEIWSVRRDGTGPRRLTTNSYYDAHPSW